MISFDKLMNYNPKSQENVRVKKNFDETDGSVVYELSAFTKKEIDRIKTFFLPTNMQYQDMVRNIVSGNLDDMHSIYATYDKMYSAAGKVLNKFLFSCNVHNFVCFLQHFKGALESIGISSCIPARNAKAKVVDYIRSSKDGLIINPNTYGTTNNISARRTSQMDPNAKYAWFIKNILSDVDDVKDNTIVIRTSDGSGPIKFYNISEDSVKRYEIDYLKSIYAKENNVNYLKIRPISFKSWKELPIEKKVGTRVLQIDAKSLAAFEAKIDTIIARYSNN